MSISGVSESKLNYNRMKKRHLGKFATVAVAICLGFASCKQIYYQVYDVDSKALTRQDNSLVYEDSDLKLMYNLWGDNGTVGFIVKNQTDKDLFIDMKRTFFILNGKAYDYFQNREYTETETATVTREVVTTHSYLASLGYWPTRYYVPTTMSGIAKQQKGHTNAVSRKEKEIVCVPANSYKVISEYAVFPTFVKTCTQSKDYPHGSVAVATYTEKESPVKFRNRLAYSFNSDCSVLKEVENDFYVSRVTNYSKKAAIETVKEKSDCNDSYKQKREYFKIGGPDKFYKTYYKTAIGSIDGMY